MTTSEVNMNEVVNMSVREFEELGLKVTARRYREAGICSLVAGVAEITQGRVAYPPCTNRTAVPRLRALRALGVPQAAKQARAVRRLRARLSRVQAKRLRFTLNLFTTSEAHPCTLLLQANKRAGL